MRVLLIEDEEQLREQLATLLRRNGYAVDLAADGEEGEFYGMEYPLDIAVVDIGLPKRSGLDVIRNWRNAGIRFPILVLTAKGSWEDKVGGLEAGADDYLVKPFHSEELLARLRALVRRAAGWTDPVLRCAPISLDTAAKIVTVAGARVDLTAYEYKVLEYLMMHAGEVLSKAGLSEHLYEDDIDRDSNVLEVLVGRLRKKLDPDRRYMPIETVRGQGYLFRLPRDGESAKGSELAPPTH